ncbi:MAG: hypothetical protein HY698_07800 [Deltaproteobacteria bacterium]|nr:hypothetical protein [Deltaproteobacteria bacterium]
MMRVIGTALLAGCLAWGCGFDDLRHAPEANPQPTDNLPGAVTIGGIQVLPAVIHPGDKVTLRDPARPRPGDPAAVYLWDACEGVLEGATHGREVTWVAPSVPGVYSVAVNISNSPSGVPSRILPLCVAPVGEDACPEVPGEDLTFETILATPDSFVQSADCEGPCETTLQAKVSWPGSRAPSYRWTTRGGEVTGAGHSVQWLLPMVGCCTESFAAAVTACGPNGSNAATGIVNVVVTPG